MLIDTRMTLSSGVRVRIRLPHATDRAEIASLHERVGAGAPGDLQHARIVHFDPRQRTVLCATTWIGGTQLLVGYGAIEHDAIAPDTLVADDLLAPGLRAALHEALAGAATDRRAA